MVSSSGVSAPDRRQVFHPFRKPRRSLSPDGKDWFLNTVGDDVKSVVDAAEFFFDVHQHEIRCEQLRGRSVHQWRRRAKRLAMRAAIWVLYRNTDLRQAEIADMLGLPDSTVNSMLLKAWQLIEDSEEFRQAVAACVVAIRPIERCSDLEGRGLRALFAFECGWVYREIACDIRCKPSDVSKYINRALRRMETDREFRALARRRFELDRLPMAA